MQVKGLVSNMPGGHATSLGDTVGVGSSAGARAVLRAVAADVQMDALVGSSHGTRVRALADTFACAAASVRVVDASVAGLGGCRKANSNSVDVATGRWIRAVHGGDDGHGLGRAAARTPTA